jgi:hypothetical protein
MTSAAGTHVAGMACAISRTASSRFDQKGLAGLQRALPLEPAQQGPWPHEAGTAIAQGTEQAPSFTAVNQRQSAARAIARRRRAAAQPLKGTQGPHGLQRLVGARKHCDVAQARLKIQGADARGL